MAWDLSIGFNVALDLSKLNAVLLVHTSCQHARPAFESFQHLIITAVFSVSNTSPTYLYDTPFLCHLHSLHTLGCLLVVRELVGRLISWLIL